MTRSTGTRAEDAPPETPPPDDTRSDATPSDATPSDATRADDTRAGEGHDATRRAPGGADGTATAGGAGDDGTGSTARPDRRRALAVVAAVSGVLAVPLVIAMVAVRSPHWYPLVDLSQIEMRVRDVGPSHPPLVGLGGRIFGLDTQGSHPGPLSFYLLAPVYRLLGGTSWALQASALTLNIAAATATVWAGYRRWGTYGALAVGTVLALAMRTWGTTVLAYPWNPYTPVLFWMLFLVCVWGVLCDDLLLLPVAVVAGSLCAQTHLPYVGLVGGIAALTAAFLALGLRRTRGDAAARRRLLRWTVGSLALALALWLPVFVEQLGGHPGNLSVIVDSLRHSDDPAVGLGRAWHLLVQHLDPVRLLRGDRTPGAAEWPGLVLLAAWVAAAAVSWRRRDRTMIALHTVVAATLVLGLVSISRILGATWFYLTLWAYGIAALTLMAVVATAARTAAGAVSRRPEGARPPAPLLARVGLGAACLALVVPSALLARSAPDTEDTDAEVSAQLGAAVGPTVAAVEDGAVGGGPDATILVSWNDPYNLGGQGMGMLLELERQGFDVGASPPFRLAVRDHRVLAADDADAELHVATGVPAVAAARAHPGATEVAYVDPRTPEQRADYDALRDDVIASLTANGLDDLVEAVDTNVVGLAADPRIPEDVRTALYYVGQLPKPLGVFTWEPGT